MVGTKDKKKSKNKSPKNDKDNLFVNPHIKIVSFVSKLIKCAVVRKLAFISILALWPISLLFSNTTANFIHYITPTALLSISLFLYDKKFKYYFVPIFAIPFADPKLAVIPLIYFLTNLILKKNKSYLICTIISLVILAVVWKPFIGQTIFRPDYELGQQAIQKSNLYHSIPLARIFQNKARIPMDKFSSNFFSLIDPNNYFFGFMPRQILIDNQNLNKYPFIALVFIIYGLINIESLKRKDFILTILSAGIINLSLLGVFDRQDFILFIPLALIIIHGINRMDKNHKTLSKLLQIIMILFAVPEILRTFIEFRK